MVCHCKRLANLIINIKEIDLKKRSSFKKKFISNSIWKILLLVIVKYTTFNGLRVGSMLLDGPFTEKENTKTLDNLNNN